MAKWDFKIVGASFVKELVPVADDVNPRSQSFMQPSFHLEGGKIVMKESGQYVTAIYFPQIGKIDGVAPTDIEDANAKLLTLVENFNGGGGTPQNLAQVLAIDNKTNDIPIVSNNGKAAVDVNDDYTSLSYETQVFAMTDTEVQFLSLVPVTFDSNVSTDFNTPVLNYNSEEVATQPYADAKVADNLTASTTVAPSKTAVNTALDAKVDKVAGSRLITSAESTLLGNTSGTNSGDNATNTKYDVTATTGAVISFATPQIYNSIASPSSSNLTDNLTGARIGVVQKIYHNAGTAPTVPAGWVLRGTGAYVTSTLNIIYAEWSVGTTVEYWITQ